jgi:hypothetical protein
MRVHPVHLNISVWIQFFSNKALFRYRDPVTAGQRFSGYSRMVIGEVTVYVLYLRVLKLYHR